MGVRSRKPCIVKGTIACNTATVWLFLCLEGKRRTEGESLSTNVLFAVEIEMNPFCLSITA